MDSKCECAHSARRDKSYCEGAKNGTMQATATARRAMRRVATARCGLPRVSEARRDADY